MQRILVHFHLYTHVSLSEISITRERHFDEIFCFYVIFFQRIYFYFAEKRSKYVILYLIYAANPCPLPYLYTCVTVRDINY